MSPFAPVISATLLCIIIFSFPSSLDSKSLAYSAPIVKTTKHEIVSFESILFQATEQPFFAGEACAKDHFCQHHEKYCGKNDAAPEALSESLAKGIASENDAFSFYLICQNSRKTARCCLEKNCVRAIERRTAIN